MTEARLRRRTPKARPARRELLVLTVGHSTRTIEDFIHLLQAYAVTCVVDVRTIPRSRHNPQFNNELLPKSLKGGGIGYIHMAGLGGLRHASRASPNAGWRNASFRGFADYMQTSEFEAALKELLKLARKERLALMCAEAVPWRCHRSLIADALLAHGISTEHILSTASSRRHTLTPFARVQGTHLTYPSTATAGSRSFGRKRAEPDQNADCRCEHLTRRRRRSILMGQGR